MKFWESENIGDYELYEELKKSKDWGRGRKKDGSGTGGGGKESVEEEGGKGEEIGGIGAEG